MLIMQVLLTFRNMALVTAAVETSLSIYISPQFPGRCYDIDFFFWLPMYYLLIELALRKLPSGTNYSLAEVAESLLTCSSEGLELLYPKVHGHHRERQKLFVR